MAEQLQNTPSIGEIVLDPNEKFADLDGVDKFDLLLCDGSELDTDKHPLLAEKLPTLEEITELGTLTASDAQTEDKFGISCAVYGSRLVVGTPIEDTSATEGGKVYIYDWNGTNYVEVGTLTASDAQAEDYFGGSCSVYGDRLVVGAFQEDTSATNGGKVYYYANSGAVLLPNMTPPDPSIPYRIIGDLT